jgi:hypothetical protein
MAPPSKPKPSTPSSWHAPPEAKVALPCWLIAAPTRPRLRLRLHVPCVHQPLLMQQASQWIRYKKQQRPRLLLLQGDISDTSVSGSRGRQALLRRGGGTHTSMEQRLHGAVTVLLYVLPSRMLLDATCAKAVTPAYMRSNNMPCR